MPINEQELARRIRAAREACRMTQEQVAESIGVPRSAIVQIEAGNRSVSSLELSRLAYLYARDLNEFVADSFNETDALAALFRAQPDVSRQPQVADALRRSVRLGREIANIETMLGVTRDIPTSASYSMPPPKTRWEAIRQGERLALEERRRLELGDSPLPDVEEMLEAQGVRTASVDLPDDVSGLTINDRDRGLFVVANRAHSRLRRRYSLAHEYCHTLADRDRFGLVSRYPERDNLIEVRANAFGAAFLMPENGFRQFVASLGKGSPSRVNTEIFDESGTLQVEGRAPAGSQTIQLYDVVQIAHHFGTSRIASLYRLRNLRLISQAEFDVLKAQEDAGRGSQLARRLGLNEPDTEETRNWFSHRFMALAIEAFRRREISRGKLDELGGLLDVDRDTISGILEDSGIDSELPPPQSGL